MFPFFSLNYKANAKQQREQKLAALFRREVLRHSHLLNQRLLLVFHKIKRATLSTSFSCGSASCTLGELGFQALVSIETLCLNKYGGSPSRKHNGGYRDQVTLVECVADCGGSFDLAGVQTPTQRLKRSPGQLDHAKDQRELARQDHGQDSLEKSFQKVQTFQCHTPTTSYYPTLSLA